MVKVCLAADCSVFKSCLNTSLVFRSFVFNHWSLGPRLDPATFLIIQFNERTVLLKTPSFSAVQIDVLSLPKFTTFVNQILITMNSFQQEIVKLFCLHFYTQKSKITYPLPLLAWRHLWLLQLSTLQFFSLILFVFVPWSIFRWVKASC